MRNRASFLCLWSQQGAGTCGLLLQELLDTWRTRQMDLSTANDILKRVRVFYAGGHKSTNKLYYASNDEAVFSHDMETQANTQRHWLNSIPMNYCKRTLRGQHTPRLLGRPVQWCRHQRPTKVVTKKVKSFMRRGDYASGNCGEMANVASYLAISVLGADRTEVWRKDREAWSSK
jgi:hypothetical protein